MRLKILFALFGLVLMGCPASSDGDGEGEGEGEGVEGEGEDEGLILCDYSGGPLGNCGTEEPDKCEAAPPRRGDPCPPDRVLGCAYCVASSPRSPREHWTCDINTWKPAAEACPP